MEEPEKLHTALAPKTSVILLDAVHQLNDSIVIKTLTSSLILVKMNFFIDPWKT